MVEYGSQEIKQELERRIDLFFEDYEISRSSAGSNLASKLIVDSHDHDDRDSINDIKINVSKFVDALLSNDNTTNPPKYLYLHGAAGIGKTHFINKLKDWILELIPNGVHFENLVVHSATELEGSERDPGVMLSCLRHQLASKKRGAVVFMDEATWLNEPNMVSSCKRVFNGDQSKISTVYFGSGSEGHGIDLAVPPMLTCVASNEVIKDEPLRDRFAIINFPMPTKQALLEYAVKKAQESETFRRQSIDLEELEPMLSRWIKNKSINNFRQVAGNVETFLKSERDSQLSALISE